MKDINNYCVIMAGGIGSRFWPMSKSSMPKQFLDILGTGKTLIQQTYHRFSSFIPDENFLVVTNDKYKNLVKEQLPMLKDEQILCEPVGRNTAPCIAYANYKIFVQNNEANVVVTPADHLILKQKSFVKVALSALKYTSVNDEIVTLGIDPTRPDTGYGYIKYDTSDESDSGTINKVLQFTEKPNLSTAKKFVFSGDYSWNSGMFFYKLSTGLEAFEKFLPVINETFKAGLSKYNTPKERDFINAIYPHCADISVDYGIMEKAANVSVINASIGWSDLGTWGSINTHLEQDDSNNAVVGDNVRLYDTRNTIVNMPKDKLVVLQGLQDFIVVDANGVLLICKKDEEQKIKQFLKDVKSEFGENSDYV